MNQYPTTVTLVALLLEFSYLTLDAIDGRHARRTGNTSPIGDLMDHGCDAIGAVFSALTLLSVLGIDDAPTQWYTVQVSVLFFMLDHISALSTGVLRVSAFTGPGELLVAVLMLFAARVLVGLEWLRSYVMNVCIALDNVKVFGSLDVENPVLLTRQAVMYLYYAMLLYTIAKMLWTLPRSHRFTKVCLAFCLAQRVIPAIGLSFSSNRLDQIDIIADGVFIAIITTDLVLAKMAGRCLHHHMMLLAMVSVLSNFLTLGCALVYLAAVFADLALYMNLPIFSINVNVYVDGVYDLCHLGHRNLFVEAASLGTRLYVGVLSDASVMEYKRKPIMTMEERMAIVATCKGVYKVVPDAPCPGIPESFLREHNIHIVAHSPEYDTPDDVYYRVPRALGMTRVLPRTDGISTSDLLRRIQARDTL